MDEIIARDGDLILKDYDNLDLDKQTDNRLYCIAYVDGEGNEIDLMLYWKRGKIIRGRSVNSPGAYGGTMEFIAAFARLCTKAQELLGDK